MHFPTFIEINVNNKVKVEMKLQKYSQFFTEKIKNSSFLNPEQTRPHMHAQKQRQGQLKAYKAEGIKVLTFYIFIFKI